MTTPDTIRAANKPSVPLESWEGLLQMARRRCQNPTPQKRGAWWTIRVYRDEFKCGEKRRAYTRVRVAPSTMKQREVQKVVLEYLRPMNQGLESLGSATNFTTLVSEYYIPLRKPTLSSSTFSRYEGVLDKYLLPVFGGMCLRDIDTLTAQKYLGSLADTALNHESRDKVRDVLSSVLGFAVEHGLLIKNPIKGLRMPKDKRGKGRPQKKYLSPVQFEAFIAGVPEPYATMVYVAIFTGLRVSELAGLRWEDVKEGSVTIDERYCRGNWDEPKSDSSNATIGVNRCVVERIHGLKLITVTVNAGLAKRKYRVVKSSEPHDLVFQSVREGKPMRDNNILTRFIKPAAVASGCPWVNWQVLRRSHATWLKMAGADVKDAQAQMRHSRASTTMDIYQQFVPESQQRAVDKLSTLTRTVQ